MEEPGLRLKKERSLNERAKLSAPAAAVGQGFLQLLNHSTTADLVGICRQLLKLGRSIQRNGGSRTAS